MLKVRIKTKDSLIYSADAFVQAVEVYIYNKNDTEDENLGEILFEWGNDVISVPGIRRRYLVAEAIKKLSQITQKAVKAEFLQLIDSLMTDPRIRIRSLFLQKNK